jgi:hypothetical protein
VAACPFLGAGVVARNRPGGVFGYSGGGASCYGRQFALKADFNGVAIWFDKAKSSNVLAL